MALVAFAALLGAQASADDYPQRPVTLVVPYPAGGAADIVARLLAQEFQDRLKQPFVVENRPGAGTVIGAASVARSAPDGYTLLLASGAALAINPSLYKSLPYAPLQDFAPIGLVGESEFALIAHPSVDARTLAELIALIRSKPGAMNYASAGIGTPHHLFMELFLRLTGLKMQHVPYRGSMAALTDVLAGQIPVMMADITTAQPMIAERRVRIFGVASPARVAALPDVPTIAEAGLPGYAEAGWFCVVTRAGTPRPVIDTLNRVLNAYLTRPDIHDRLLAAGIRPRTSTPDELEAHIAAELRKWAEVVKDAGIAAQ